jgi:hypothetical protein
LTNPGKRQNQRVDTPQCETESESMKRNYKAPAILTEKSQKFIFVFHVYCLTREKNQLKPEIISEWKD